MLKQIRIGADGKIVDADRSTHTTKAGGKGGPDQVQWVRAPGVNGNYTIRFPGGPFQAGHSIEVPPGGPHTVSQPPGTYKYDVLDGSGGVTDDPDVIIDS
ncbi:MAG TPA: hypothetical protein VFB92_22960 [Vicinamibacterales bacterium]|jgi:hypothetical protein|nr:hypothetical protein [Vicinamibacterales bacterium]